MEVMVIYRDDDLSKLLEMILTDHGYQTRLYSERREACTALLELQPNLIIIEPIFGKPQADLQFIRNLRANPLSAHLSMILCTVDTTNISEQNLYFQSALENIQVQPFDEDQLLASINDLLAQAPNN